MPREEKSELQSVTAADTYLLRARCTYRARIRGRLACVIVAAISRVGWFRIGTWNLVRGSSTSRCLPSVGEVVALGDLSAEQKRKTMIQADAPADILTRETPKVAFEAAEGMAAESMTADQRRILLKLIHEYIDRMPEEVAKAESRKLHDAGIADIHFAWAGAEEPGKPHYYRLHGPFLFVEYDNTQNDANHIHSVWRHLEDDFGVDLLRHHYRNRKHHDR